jgi:hypothetical protein
MVGENPQAAEGQGVSVGRAHRRHRGRLGADGRGRRVSDAVGLQRLLSSTWSTAAAGSAWRWWCLPPGGPGKALLGALLFAFLTRCSCACSSPVMPLGLELPYQLYLMLPYVLSIVALVLVARKASAIRRR